MADELQLTLSGTYTNGSLKDLIQSETLKVTQTTKGFLKHVFSIGASAETITFTDITTLGWLYLKNLDATNFVTYGPDSSGQVDFGKLKPGEFALMRVKPGITIKATADTAACKVLVAMWED